MTCVAAISGELPVNFLAFSLVTVVIVSGTLPVFGEMLHDPIATVARIDNSVAVLLGAFAFVTATIGINIVANFVSPAFDFANVAPSKISWRAGGMIAAMASIFITPWNLFNNPEVIHYTLDVLAAFIGPLFGILLVDYYLIKKQQIDVDALFNDGPSGRYYYSGGINWTAVKALIPATLMGVAITFIPVLQPMANFAGSPAASSAASCTSHWPGASRHSNRRRWSSLDDVRGDLKVFCRHLFLSIWLIIDSIIFRPGTLCSAGRPGLCFYCRVTAMDCVVEVFR